MCTWFIRVMKRRLNYYCLLHRKYLPLFEKRCVVLKAWGLKRYRIELCKFQKSLTCYLIKKTSIYLDNIHENQCGQFLKLWLCLSKFWIFTLYNIAKWMQIDWNKKSKMVNNALENSENEKETISSNDDNGNGHRLSGCSSNDDVNPYKSYARRRKCNENVQVCEKQKKRESYQRVSWNIWWFFISFWFKIRRQIVQCIRILSSMIFLV